ncbi:hypothetical protein DERP_014022 [Dermatophagoides pteronyssinus]|uniref:Uncharacterized protein n=1 Tax=Dermatophagoides pteronyssinus TaxID=6956 RepID=A0ABQ8JCX2_DERPT|nr:hypothetical protein DERP_014022 [Dermatophagoides pteronyssinus]
MFHTNVKSNKQTNKTLPTKGSYGDGLMALKILSILHKQAKSLINLAKNENQTTIFLSKTSGAFHLFRITLDVN